MATCGSSIPAIRPPSPTGKLSPSMACAPWKAASLDNLQLRLEKLFQPIAPTVRIFPSARRPAPTNLPPAAEIIRYRHSGVGLTSAPLPSSPYKSERVKSPANAAPMPEPFAAELVPGLSASVPLALYVDLSLIHISEPTRL